jgi:quinol monooxygenase YgiN
MADVSVGLLVRVVAKAGKEAEVEGFLEAALPMVEREPGTIAWFALRLGHGEYGIFDVFPDDSARAAHLSGRVAAALEANAGELYSEPSIERIDVIASKLPG